MSGVISLTSLRWQQFGTVLESLLGITYVVIAIGFPLALYMLWTKKFATLDTEEVRERFGSFYENIKTDKKSNVLVPLYFYIRRLLLSFAVIYWRDDLYLQLFQMYAQVVAHVIIVGQLRPHTTNYEFVVTILNELFVLACTYLFMSCSHWVSDRDTKSGIGYVLCLVVALHWLVNFALIMKIQIAWLREKHCINSAAKGLDATKK